MDQVLSLSKGDLIHSGNSLRLIDVFCEKPPFTKTLRRSASKVLDAKTSSPRSRITPRLKSCLTMRLKLLRVVDYSKVPISGLPSEIRARAATSAVQDF